MSWNWILTVLLARKWVVLSVFALTVLVSALVSFLLPNQYTATTSVIINAKGSDPVTGYMLPATLMPGYIATQTDVIQSRNVALKVVDKLGIVNSPIAKERFQKATKGEGDIRLWFAEQFLEDLSVKPARESSVIEIAYTSTDAQFSATMANAFAAAYLDTTFEINTEPVKKAAQFFDKELAGLRKKLELAQANLSQYQQAHGITMEEGRLDVETARLSELSSQLVAAQSQVFDVASKSSQIKQNGASEAPEVLGNPLIQGLKSQLAQAEAKLSDASQRLGSNHPQYIALQEEVNHLKRSIATETARTGGGVSQSTRASQMKESEIRTALAAQKERVLKLRKEYGAMAVLVREVEGAQRIYDNALLKLGQTSLESHGSQSDISILNPALPPMEHSKPKRMLNILLAVLLGGLLAIFTGIAMEMLNRRVRTADDIKHCLGTVVLADFGELPRLNFLMNLRKLNPRAKKLKFKTSSF